MTSLSFPDVNVWLALADSDHLHYSLAKCWWENQQGEIYFTRTTQLGFLRLVTTAVARRGAPLTMAGAWQAHDWFFGDVKTAFFPEAPGAEAILRVATSGPTVSPKVWADAWLLAVAEAAGAGVVTFDRALGSRGAHCLLGNR
jgi:toxin-antitoxin system PIN domain toxin